MPLKVAIIRLTAMGDIIHSASVLPKLSESFHQKIEITWFVDSHFAEILQNCPFVKNLVTIPLKDSLKNRDFSKIKEIILDLRQRDFDMVIDFQGLIKSAILGKFLKTQQYFGFSFKSTKESLASFFYTNQVEIPYKEHILLRNATLLFSAFKLPIPNLESLLHTKAFLGYDSQIPLPPLKEKTKILCVLETSKKNKTYPKEKFIEFAKMLNDFSIKPYFLTYSANLSENENFIPLNNLSLNAIKSLINKMDLIIGGDTGITHLAWAFNKPSITLFGATPPKRFHLLTKQNLYLCGNENPNYKKNDFSIKNITKEQIFDFSKALLGNKL